MPQSDQGATVAIIGTGIAGIATAYYLATRHGITDIVLVDAGQPMAFTSAQSGENYRNWWPHPTMVTFTNRSIDLMEAIAKDSDNQINMTRRGYALATRETEIEALLKQLAEDLGPAGGEQLRVHDTAAAPGYQHPTSPAWERAPAGVDILSSQDLIASAFPSFGHEIRRVIHIRRAGDISGQQLGTYMLDRIRALGGRRLTGMVEAIERTRDFTLIIRGERGVQRLRAERVINAAGPFADRIATMLDVELPIHNVFQQKIAFDDREKAIPRDMPFSIDLDRQEIDWSEEERALLQEDAEVARLAQEMPGAVHCRPDGGDRGTWLRLGWAFNSKQDQARWDPPLVDSFPEVVLRGAARLNPSLKRYYGALPRGMHHYGGWYTMTEENWPLIGKMGPKGAFMNVALSGFGTMAACASGELCAAWVAEAALPSYARAFSLDRYQDKALMQVLSRSSRGLL